MNNYRLTIDLSGDMLEEIKRYKDITHKQNIKEAVNELIKYALNLPLYFRQFDWKKSEEDADNEIALGNVKSFDTVDDLISDLEK
ncbi:MAG: hypothetical protein B6D61_07095 [Bacteroidetes bacterium 4484_249]|nr:MAG: hypothetical protein B6D61_07095 [Bacteroidetes bacterium 4484_249]